MQQNRYRSVLIAVITFLAFSEATASKMIDDDFAPVFFPTLMAVRIQGSINIDGVLDEEGWKSASRAVNFVETSPGDQVKPPVKSEALIAYDETHLYVALIAHDDPKDIRVSLRDRDEIFRDDYFGIMLDTYGDYAWGYEIFVNPLGIQGDLRILASGNEDMSFDIVFDSRGMVTDSGYQVELAIPFSSLRFPDKPQQTWRLNFWRDHQREVRRRYSWAAQNRDDPCWVCQWGELTGIENIKPSSNIDILPNLVGFQSGRRDNVSQPLDNTDPDAEVSLSGRYGLSSNSSVEFTINPDFSQVESDAAQIDVNTTFGLFFPERRPFFQEGSDLFNSSISAIYTRTINDPEVAAKFTGQFGRTRIAYLVGRDENTPILIPLEEKSLATLVDKSTSNIVRVRQSIQQDSHLGVMFTNKQIDDFTVDGVTGSGGSGTVYGTDGSLRFASDFRVQWQALGSYTNEVDAPSLITDSGQVLFNQDRNTVALDGESYSGHAGFTKLSYDSRFYSAQADYWEFSPTFRADNGFITRNGHRNLNFWNGLTFQPNGKWIINWGPSWNVGRIWSYDGRFRDEWFNANFHARLKGQTDVTLFYMNSRELFGDILFVGISQGDLRIDSRFSEILSGGVSLQYGKRIFRSTPEMADKIGFSTYANFKPTQRLFIQPSFDYLKFDSRGDGSTISKGYITRTRANYQITREWFIRLVVQYNDFSKRIDFEPLLTYRVNPFTVFYVGSTAGYERFDPNEDNSLLESQWKLSSRQFFAKLQYLIRI